MTLAPRDKRALILLGVALAVLLIWRWLLAGNDATAEASVDSARLLERQIERLRKDAATAPSKEALLKHTSAQAAAREKGMLAVETAEQAQAELLKITRAVAKEHGIDARGGEFGPIRALGSHYGEVSVAVSFECGVEQLVNLLAGLTQRAELLATNEIQMLSANPKLKTVNVRLTLAGVVPRKLVPEKKGVSLF